MFSSGGSVGAVGFCEVFRPTRTAPFLFDILAVGLCLLHEEVREREILMGWGESLDLCGLLRVFVEAYEVNFSHSLEKEFPTAFVYHGIEECIGGGRGGCRKGTESGARAHLVYIRDSLSRRGGSAAAHIKLGLH